MLSVCAIKSIYRAPRSSRARASSEGSPPPHAGTLSSRRLCRSSQRHRFPTWLFNNSPKSFCYGQDPHPANCKHWNCAESPKESGGWPLRALTGSFAIHVSYDMGASPYPTSRKVQPPAQRQGHSTGQNGCNRCDV